MKGSIGRPTQIVTVIPHLLQMSRLSTTELSTKAKFRLEVFDWYSQKSGLVEFRYAKLRSSTRSAR
jgi:hypothetical protein